MAAISRAALLHACPPKCARGLGASPATISQSARLAAGVKHLSTCNAAVSTYFVTKEEVEESTNVDISLLPLCGDDMTILSLGRDITLPPVTEASLPPTPALPSGTMMAEFLLAYQRMLEHECTDGDHAVEAGEGVLEQIKIGLNALLHHPLHGAYAGTVWQRNEAELESCLRELEKDMHAMLKYHKQQPTRMALRLTSLHCMEAARLLRRL